jgi:hypothetical protein
MGDVNPPLFIKYLPEGRGQPSLKTIDIVPTIAWTLGLNLTTFEGVPLWVRSRAPVEVTDIEGNVIQ